MAEKEIVSETFTDLGDELGVTFTSGTTYTIQVSRPVKLKIDNTEFDVIDNLTLTSTGDDVYIKTLAEGAFVSVL